MMNLLADPVLRVRTSRGPVIVSLPELLALLGEDRVESLSGLQRHQEDAFHIFSCYLAAAVLVRQGKSNPVQSASFWLQGIRALTKQEGCEDDSAWMLVVDDPTKPAFMQPPASCKEIYERDYKAAATHPNALDVLVTSRNHDIKQARGRKDDLEAWLFTLISLQTTVGVLGKGSGGGMNRGIGRMNKGHGSRPRVGWIPGVRPGAQFARDIVVLLASREHLLRSPYVYASKGNVLLWIRCWDGKQSLALASLDPFFIEVARRVRLCTGRNGIEAFSSGSAVNLIAADELKGNLGDPWIPISQRTNGALTVSESGFTPELLRGLIFSDGYSPAAMQRMDHSTAAGYLSASVLVRGQGVTDGFHSAVLRIPQAPRLVLRDGGNARDRLATLSKKGLDAAGVVQYKALRPALYSLFEGGPESIVLDKTEVSQWVDHAAKPFVTAWYPRFFSWLWTTVDIADDIEALRPWFNQLRRLAQETLGGATDHAPQRHGRSYRSKIKAKDILVGSLKKNFPYFMEVRHDES